MTIQPGENFRAKGGELLEALEFTNKTFRFRMRDPITKEYAGGANVLEGPLESLRTFFDKQEIKKIDLETYVPTGLVEK